MESDHVESIVDLAATLASRADEYDQVLILYRRKEDGFLGSMDNELSLQEALWLASGFTFWLQAGAMGLLKKVKP